MRKIFQQGRLYIVILLLILALIFYVMSSSTSPSIENAWITIQRFLVVVWPWIMSFILIVLFIRIWRIIAYYYRKTKNN